jgi:hypothetical protein
MSHITLTLDLQEVYDNRKKKTMNIITKGGLNWDPEKGSIVQIREYVVKVRGLSSEYIVPSSIYTAAIHYKCLHCSSATG